MNYFEFYPGDYMRDTADLSPAGHGCYLLLMCAYYSAERPLPEDVASLYRITKAMDKGEQAATREIADRFFPVEEDGLRHNARADAEIAKAQKRIKAARENGKKGGSPLKKAGYNEPGFLYAIQRAGGGPVKVGITKNVRARYGQLTTQYGSIREIALYRVSDMGGAEAHIHSIFSAYLDGEWVSASTSDVLMAMSKIPLNFQPKLMHAGDADGQPSSVPTGQLPGIKPAGQSAAQSGEALHMPHATCQGASQEQPKSDDLGAASEPAANCPHAEIVASYHELLPSLARVRDWTAQRQALLRKRWSEKSERQSLDWWREFFAYVGQSDFLMGRKNSPGRDPFECDLEWLVSPKNFIKVLEGKYENRSAA